MQAFMRARASGPGALHSVDPFLQKIQPPAEDFPETNNTNRELKLVEIQEQKPVFGHLLCFCYC